MRLVLVLLLFSEGILAQKMDPPVLDSFIEKTVKEKKAAGATVLVASKGKIILNKGYGFAHLGLEAKTTPGTRYFLAGPGTIMLAAAIMQLVEQEKISIDDPVNKYLPDFPLQNRKVLLRHLLTSTSGIPDYHYLGDPFIGLKYQPRSLDEVINLFEGQPFLSEPGEKFDWSISNFALLVAILEKVTGVSFDEYTKKNLLDPLSLSQTEFLLANRSFKNLAEGYLLNDGNYSPFTGSLFKYDPSLRLISTNTDLFNFLSSLRNGKIIKMNSYSLMTSRLEAEKNKSGYMGYGIRLTKEDSVEAIGVSGGLEGFSTYMNYFPGRDMTVIVLSNTSDQVAGAIGRALSRWLLDLPPIVTNSPVRREIENVMITEMEAKKLAGTYILSRSSNEQSSPRTSAIYKRTVRIYYDNGKMVLQRFGELPIQLYKQSDGSFRFNMAAVPVITFTMNGGKQVLSFKSASLTDAGPKVGEADAKTFRTFSFQNLK